MPKVDFQFFQGICLSRYWTDLVKTQEFTFELPALDKLGQDTCLNCMPEDYMVYFPDRVGWMREIVGKVTIIGQDDKALCVLVETTCTKQAKLAEFAWNQVVNSLIVMRVCPAADKPFGFVQEQRYFLCLFQPITTSLYQISSD